MSSPPMWLYRGSAKDDCAAKTRHPNQLGNGSGYSTTRNVRNIAAISGEQRSFAKRCRLTTVELDGVQSGYGASL